MLVPNALLSIYIDLNYRVLISALGSCDSGSSSCGANYGPKEEDSSVTTAYGD